MSYRELPFVSEKELELVPISERKKGRHEELSRVQSMFIVTLFRAPTTQNSSVIDTFVDNWCNFSFKN